MLILIILLVIGLVFLGIALLLSRKGKNTYRYDDGITFTIVLTAIIFGAFLCLGIYAICCVATRPVNKMELEQERITLVTQLEIYKENDNDINFESLSWRELYNDIKRYNTTIKKHQYWNKKWALKIFYNPLLDDLEIIEL